MALSDGNQLLLLCPTWRIVSARTSLMSTKFRIRLRYTYVDLEQHYKLPQACLCVRVDLYDLGTDVDVSKSSSRICTFTSHVACTSCSQRTCQNHALLCIPTKGNSTDDAGPREMECRLGGIDEDQPFESCGCDENIVEHFGQRLKANPPNGY